MENDKREQSKQLLNRGSEIVGGAAGAVIGSLVGGPFGAAGGVVLGVQMNHALQDMANRMLSSQEQARIGASGEYALNRIKTRLGKGETLRNDDFFTPLASGNTKFTQTFEGILLKAKNSYEEKKIKYLGELLANIAFDSSCSDFEANHLIEIAESLTYTQYCLLHIDKNPERYGLRDKKLLPQENVTTITLNLLQQTFDLFRYHFVLLYAENDKDHIIVLEPNEIIPRLTKLSVQGERIYSLLNLGEIPSEDITIIVKSLSNYLEYSDKTTSHFDDYMNANKSSVVIDGGKF